MASGFKVNTNGFKAALKAVRLTSNDMLQIEGAGAHVLLNGMRARTPVLSGATRASENSHIVEATETRVIDDVGPETNYAPFIEYGVQSKPNYPIQPFVRPTVEEDEPQVVNAISSAFGETVKARWPS